MPNPDNEGCASRRPAVYQGRDARECRARTLARWIAWAGRTRAAWEHCVWARLVGDPIAVDAIMRAAKQPFAYLEEWRNLREFQRKCAYALARIEPSNLVRPSSNLPRTPTTFGRRQLRRRTGNWAVALLEWGWPWTASVVLRRLATACRTWSPAWRHICTCLRSDWQSKWRSSTRVLGPFADLHWLWWPILDTTDLASEALDAIGDAHWTSPSLR